MYQSHKHESDVTIAPQAPSTPALASDELTAVELAHVVGGTSPDGYFALDLD